MRHRARVSTFNLKSGPRKALLRGLVRSLVEHGRIKTTEAKAKELRRHVERAITVAKRGGMHAQRLLLSRYPNPDTVEKLVDDLGPRFMSRAGGYTRILKLGSRVGDKAPMAFIEFVDYKPAVATEEDKDVLQLAKRKVARRTELKAKRIRKHQSDSRRVARA